MKENDLELKKQMLKEIKNRKNDYIQTVQQKTSAQLIDPTIRFLEDLKKYQGKYDSIDLLIQQYSKMASDYIRMLKKEEEIKGKGR